MPEKSRIREITITDDKGTFNAIFRRFSGSKDYDFEALTMLRRLLSNEKARLLHFLKTKKPGSIYELAKMVERDFKSVSDDIKLLEKFGFVDMIPEKTGKRERLRPVLVANSMQINIKI
jgi:predicted transcriptional regulator